MPRRLLLCAALALVLRPTPAHACGPLPPGLSSSVPADGEMYPSNADILLHGSQLGTSKVTVTVDGMPATLVPGISLAAVAPVQVRVEPEPMPGQLVTLSGDFCSPDQTCDPQSFSFTATAPDDIAPPSPTALGFDLYDHGTYDLGGAECEIGGDFTYYFRVSAELPAPGESLSYHLIEVEYQHDPGTVVASLAVPVYAADAEYSFRRFDSFAAGHPLEDLLCVRVRSFDLAGHASGESVTGGCAPCHVRVDDSTDDPVQPMWTEADIYPEGPCAGMQATSGGPTTGDLTTAGSSASSSEASAGGGEDKTDAGCACRSGHAPSDTWLLALAILGLARRRRAYLK